MKILDLPVLAMVDTGSNSTVIGNQGFPLLHSLHLPIQHDSCLNITTADGVPQQYMGYISAPVTVNDVTKTVKILIIPSITHNLILGMDFLSLFKIDMSFHDLSYSLLSSTCVINTIQSASALSMEEKNKLEETISLFSSLAPPDRIGRTSFVEHDIDTGDAKPIAQRQYPLSPAMQELLVKEVDDMLRLNVIQPSNSPWCSPLWLVPKKSGECRVCFDGRKLNRVTIPDSYPMAQVDVILSKLRDAKFLTSIDLKKAFLQIPLTESSRPKTAFAVYGLGLFEFTTTPYGLINAPKTMARLMDIVIDPSLRPYCFCYLDDIIIATPTFELHLEILNKLYLRLKEANLTVNFQKCEFCRDSLKFLGFVVDKAGLRTDEEKVSAILNYPAPKNTTEIKRLIGLIGWYRRFIKDFSTVCSPITDLLHGRKKGQSISWTLEAENAFIEIKKRLTSSPILASPDFSKEFIIQTDASDTGLGAILYQQCDGIEHPVAYASRTLNKTERKYSTTEKELLGVIFGVEKFRGYVEGTHFTLETDHSSLQYLSKLSNPSGRLARLSLRLSQFDFEIKHRKGTTMVISDALSRSFPDISVIDVTTFKPDTWYTAMIDKVNNNPESFPTFKVENNVLYKHVFSPNPISSNLSNWKIVVPNPNRIDVLKTFHDDQTSAHLGISKTIARISEIYYWPKLRSTVSRYINKCSVCSSCKTQNLPKAGIMGQYKDINFPWQWISADLIGPYPRSKNGNRFVLVITDWFTKFCLVHPMQNATAAGIVKFIENQVFLIFGVPQIFSVDNGTVFTSSLFKNLMDQYKVQKIFYNARYHPQANHTERTNKTIVTALRCYIHDNASHKNWDASLHKVAQAIRTAKHDVTGYSPAFLNFARNVPLSGDFYGAISENANNLINNADKLQLIDDLQTLPKLYIDVRKKLKQAHDRNSKYYNLRKRDIEYHVGDRLWKKNYVLSSKNDNFAAKFAPKFIPCIVHKVVSKLVYNLRDLSGNDLGNWHVSDLKNQFIDVDENLPDDLEHNQDDR